MFCQLNGLFSRDVKETNGYQGSARGLKDKKIALG